MYYKVTYNTSEVFIKFACLRARRRPTSIFSRMFTEALLVMGKKWEEPKCPLVGGLIKSSLWYTGQ